MRKQALEPVVGQPMSRSAKETPPVVTHVALGSARARRAQSSPQSAAGAAPRMHTVYAGTPSAGGLTGGISCLLWGCR